MSRLDSQTQVIVPVTFIHSLATQSHHPASCLCCLCCICKPLPSLPSLPLLTTPFANHSLWKPFPLQTTPFSPSQNISVLFNTLRAEKRSWEHQARFSPNNLPHYISNATFHRFPDQRLWVDTAAWGAHKLTPASLQNGSKVSDANVFVYVCASCSYDHFLAWYCSKHRNSRLDDRKCLTFVQPIWALWFSLSQILAAQHQFCFTPFAIRYIKKNLRKSEVFVLASVDPRQNQKTTLCCLVHFALLLIHTASMSSWNLYGNHKTQATR